jgi:PAS domain S-box-containing protein
MADRRPTYEELSVRVKMLEDENAALKQAAADLRLSEEDYRVLVDNLRAGIYRTTGDPYGRIVKANPAMAKIFGYGSTDELAKVSVSELYVNPDDRKRFIEEVQSSGNAIGKELLLKKRDGTPMWVSCTATIRYDEFGDVKWIDGIMEDITDRKRAEEALRESEEEYRTLVDNLSAGVYRNTGGPQGRFLTANPAIVQIHGYDSLEEFMKASVSELYLNAEDRRAFVEEVKNKGCVKGKELPLKKKDGTPIWGSCTATIKYDEDGEVRWIDGIIEDITDRKLAEEALKRTNEILDNILSASPVGIGLVESGKISWANSEMIRMFGFETDKDYIGKGIDVVYPSREEYDRVNKAINSLIRAGKPAGVDALYQKKNGTTFVGHFKMSCPDPSTPSKRAIFTIYDISWRTQAEKERLRREKLQGVLEMAGAVCHEMNQPIQGISGYTETLLMKLSNHDPSHEKIRRIQALSKKMGQITSKLMRITKYETKDYAQGIKIIDIDKSVIKKPLFDEKE